MIARQLLGHIVNDEALTRGLRDPEARMLVEWLVDQAEHSAGVEAKQAKLVEQIGRLRLRGRAISRFVHLWCYGGARGAALQLASTERFAWPLPATGIGPCALMQNILDWETRHPPACVLSA
jgi:hypothetical protein